MLARTADNLFWLARYIERADFIARTIEATVRLEYMPRGAEEEAGAEWISALEAAGAHECYAGQYGAPTEAGAVYFLTFDNSNPSSICNCLENARANARAVRTALTEESWTTINDAWLRLKQFESARGENAELEREALTSFLDFVKKTSLDFEGTCYRSMLRNDAYWFNRLGLLIERADNTARLLDVKYHLLLPPSEKVGGSLDYSQWVAILRAVSAVNAYTWIYRDRVKPWLIADLLILRPEMPRSLLYCYATLDQALRDLARGGGASGAAQRQARATRERLERARIGDIFQSGLHEFVTDFIEENARLALTISEQYLFV